MINEEKQNGNNELSLSINGIAFKWGKQYITGAEIRELCQIPEEHEIFLKIKDPWEDEEITDETRVDLARPEREDFFTKKQHKDIIIIIKGKPIQWDKPQITYVEVITLAYGEYNDSPTMVYTVGYEDGPKENREGSMLKGMTVYVKNKMIFHATATDKS